MTYYWPESGNCIIFDESNAVLDEIYSFVEETVSLGLSVLIHSTDGVSRASFCAAIYFMLKYRWTLPKTLQYLQSKRPDLAPRPGFMRQLSALNDSLQRVTREAVGTADPALMKRFTDWNVDVIRRLISSSSPLPIPVAEDELLLTITFLNSRAQPGSMIAKARAPVGRSRAASNGRTRGASPPGLGGRGAGSRRVSWIDDPHRQGTTHANVPLSPMTRRPSVERPPSASYSAVRAGPGWVDLLLPRAGARQGLLASGPGGADTMPRPYANGLPHRGDDSRVSSILRVRGDAPGHAAPDRPRSAPAARSPPAATPAPAPSSSSSSASRQQAARAAAGADAVATAASGKRLGPMDPSAFSTSRPIQQHGAASAPPALSPVAAPTAEGRLGRPSSAPASRSPPSASAPAPPQASATPAHYGHRAGNGAQRHLGASASAAHLPPAAPRSAVPPTGAAPGQPQQHMRGSASAPSLPPAGNSSSGPGVGREGASRPAASAHHIGVKPAWGTAGAPPGRESTADDPGLPSTVVDGRTAAGLGGGGAAFGRASRRLNGAELQAQQTSSRHRPVSAALPVEHPYGSGDLRAPYFGAGPPQVTRDARTRPQPQFAATGDGAAWGMSSAYGSYANGRSARTSHRHRGPTPPPRQRPQAAEPATPAGDGSGPQLAASRGGWGAGGASWGRQASGGPGSAPADSASWRAGSLFPPPPGEAAGADAAVSRRRGSGFGRASGVASSGSGGSLSSTWGPGDRLLEPSERPGWPRVDALARRTGANGHVAASTSSSVSSATLHSSSRSSDARGAGDPSHGHRNGSQRSSSARRAARAEASRAAAAADAEASLEHQRQSHAHRQHPRQQQLEAPGRQGSRSSRPFSARPASASRGRPGEAEAPQQAYRGGAFGSAHGAGGSRGGVAVAYGSAGGVRGPPSQGADGRRRSGSARAGGFSAGAPYAVPTAGASTMPVAGLAWTHREGSYGVTVGGVAGGDARPYGRGSAASRRSLDPMRKRPGSSGHTSAGHHARSHDAVRGMW